MTVWEGPNRLLQQITESLDGFSITIPQRHIWQVRAKHNRK